MPTTPSETSIANGALIILGERRISSIDEESKTARLLKDRFAETRDELLRDHPWNFATKRAALAANAEDPVWGFGNAFTLPSDCLRVLDVQNEALLPYRIEGRNIVTDIGAPLNIEYVARVEDPQQMDVLFRQALAAKLAAELAEAITGTDTKVETANAILAGKLREARTINGQEPSPRQVQASEWLDSREESGRSLERVPSGPGTPL